MILNSHKTAITRKALPVPTRWLLKNNLIKGHVLDYGCGKCAEVNQTMLQSPVIKSVTSYDPHWEPLSFAVQSRLKWDTIICNYVLCTLPKEAELELLTQIRHRIAKSGVAYVSVRNDVPKSGYGMSRKGTFQRKVELNLPVVHKTSQYRIYLLTRWNTFVY